jgi:putative endonuclease
MFYVYILYSKLMDKYYVGFTGTDLEERLRKHLSSHKGFTGRAKDWHVVHFESFDEKSEALLREQTIKKWKSRLKIIELVAENK